MLVARNTVTLFHVSRIYIDRTFVYVSGLCLSQSHMSPTPDKSPSLVLNEMTSIYYDVLKPN